MKNISTENREFLPRIEADIQQRFPIASFFLLITLILKFGFKIPLTNALFYLISLIALGSIPASFILEKLKAKNPKTAINFYFLFILFDLILITAIIYFIGGINWVIPGIYLLYIVNIFWLFPKNQAIFLVIWVNLLFILLVLATYFKVLPSLSIFLPREENLWNPSFVLTTTIMAVAILVFVGYTSDNFYWLLNKKINELSRKRKELAQTKGFLELEVETRTQELQQEKERVNRGVEGKTKELEAGKKIIEEKVKDLEKFHKMAVLRELKMAQIKEKIAKLKEAKSKNEKSFFRKRESLRTI